MSVYLKNRKSNAGFIEQMDLKELGGAIRARRKSRKVVQADLAEIAGISDRTLRDIENGTANPELSTLLKICGTLGMEIKIDVIK
jgi:y4mF family transcriptional regulator